MRISNELLQSYGENGVGSVSIHRWLIFGRCCCCVGLASWGRLLNFRAVALSLIGLTSIAISRRKKQAAVETQARAHSLATTCGSPTLWLAMKLAEAAYLRDERGEEHG